MAITVASAAVFIFLAHNFVHVEICKADYGADNVKHRGNKEKSAGKPQPIADCHGQNAEAYKVAKGIYLNSEVFFRFVPFHCGSDFSVKHIRSAGKKQTDYAPKRVPAGGKENSADGGSRAGICKPDRVVVKTDKLHNNPL